MKKSLEQLRDAAYAALKAKLGDPYAPNSTAAPWHVLATFEDQVIVERGAELTAFPVSWSLFGEAMLGEPVKVEQAWVPIKEAHGSRILGPIVEEGASAKAGSRWAVVVIAEGLSLNRTLYPSTTLQEAAPRYAGAKVFWNHSNSAMRDPRDIAGVIRSPRFALIEGEHGGSAIVATLHATSPQLRESLLEAHEAGEPDLFGLSHTAQAETERVVHTDGRAALRVKQIKAVESVDVVSFPSAGGRVVRLVAGMASPVPSTEEDLMTLEQKLAKLKEARPDLAARLSATPTESDVDALLLEAITAAKTEPAPTPEPAPAPAKTEPQPVVRGLSEAEVSLLREATVDRALQGRTLPEPLRESLRASLLGRPDLTMDIAKAEVDRTVAAAAKLDEGRPASGSGAGAEVTKDEADRVVEAVDGFFARGMRPEAAAEYKKLNGGKDAPDGYRSIRDLYESVTGDKGVTGYLTEAVALGRFQRLTESIQVSTFANLLVNSMTKRMLAEYRSVDAQYMNWRRLCSTISPLRDFRTQDRLRWGSFGDLPVVGELAPYTEYDNPTDEKVQFTPAKRGKILGISREAILNDDVGFVQRVPQKMALAAARTLNTFVFKLFTSNPTLDDTVALYAAATTRGATAAGNLIATQLSAVNVEDARIRLMTVKDRDSNVTLGLSPYLIVVPPALEALTWRLTQLSVAPVPDQNATEPNIIPQQYGLRNMLVQPDLLDTDGTTPTTDNCFIFADPRMVDTIEMGFVNGREEPELLVQDNPSSGSMFNNDKLQWKERHEYGGKVVEWRGMIGIIPA